MNFWRRTVATPTVILGLVVALGCGKRGEPEIGPNGGYIAEEDGRVLEALYTNLGVEIWLSTAEGEPIVAFPLRGAVTIRSGEEEIGKTGLHPRQRSLFGPFDFSELKEELDITYEITGFSDGKKESKFELPFTLAKLIGFSCPSHPEMTFFNSAKCVKCGGEELVATDLEYRCDTHPKIYSMYPGECPKCDGLFLTLRPASVDRDQAN